MFFVSKDGSEVNFGDANMGYLEELLKLIDTSLVPINNAIDNASVWDVESFCDHGEYLIGSGFCVMQRYLFDVLQDIKIDAGLARDLGPKTQKGVAVAKLIHSAANYWKHSPEWHIWLTELGQRSQNTVDNLLHGRESASYPLSDLLADLCKEDTLLLSNCLPYLVEWRLAIYEYISKNV